MFKLLEGSVCIDSAALKGKFLPLKRIDEMIVGGRSPKYVMHLHHVWDLLLA